MWVLAHSARIPARPGLSPGIQAAYGRAPECVSNSRATAIYASTKHWAVVIPPLAWAGGLGAALLIGAAAGLLPALRAARLSPTEALWTL